MRIPLRSLVVLGLACVTGLVGCSHERPGQQPKHLILITVAGLRADHLSSYAYERPTSAKLPGSRPEQALAIDQLGEAGVRFANASADGAVDLRELNVLIGAAGGGVEAWSAHSLKRPVRVFRTQRNDPGSASTDDAFRSILGDHVSVHPTDGATLAGAIQWISDEDWNDLAPRVLWVHLNGPTLPWEPGLMALPTTKDTVNFGTLFTDTNYTGTAEGTLAFRDAGANLTPADEQHLVDLYDGEIAKLNVLIYALLDTYRYFTREADAWPETAIVFTGVSGMTLPGDGHAWGHEIAPVEGALHVPLFLHHPASLTGRRIFETPVAVTDVMTTIAPWVHALYPADGHGRSLLDHVDAKPQADFDERPTVTRFADGSVSVRDVRWRWTQDASGVGRLIDVARDPRGQCDLQADHSDIVQRLRAAAQDL
jgi:hypothetical protein